MGCEIMNNGSTFLQSTVPCDLLEAENSENAT
jgi:hypothetical protein